MRILLDKSLPRPFARLLPEHEVRTVSAVGWTGTRKGELLKLDAGSFDAFVTADKNLGMLPAVVLIAPTNRNRFSP